MALTKITSNQVVFKSTGTGAVVRTLTAKLTDQISVKDFGAVGDGVTDDTAAIQAAINASPFGAVVFIPPGQYKLSSTLNLKDGITLSGAGRNSATTPTTQLIFTTLTGSTPAIKVTNGSDVTLRNLYVSGRASGSGDEIQIYGNSRRIRIEDVTVNTATTGSAINVGVGGYCIQSLLMGCAALGAAYGFTVSASSTSISMIGCYGNVNTVAGFNIQGTYISLSGCASDGNGLYGYLLQNAKSLHMSGCGAESSGRTALAFVTAGNVVIDGFRSVSNNTSGSASYPSVASIDYGSYNITATGVEDTSPHTSTVYSIANIAGTAPSNVEICGTFTKPFSAAIVANEAPRMALCAVTQFDGTIASPTSGAGRNISGITKNAAGDYTITFSTLLQPRTIVAVGNAAPNGSVAIVVGQVASTSNTVRIRCFNSATGALIDSPLINISIFAL